MNDETTLGEICNFTYGKALREDKRIPAGVPVFGSNGIVGWHNQAITAGPTIIIGRKGSIGKVTWSDRPCYPIDTTYFVDTTLLPCELKWLYYALKAIDLTRLDKSAAVPGLNRDDAYEQRIVVPSVPEQQRVAGLLDAAVHQVELRRYALQLSQTLLSSAFIEFFGDPRGSETQWPTEPLAQLGSLDRGRSQHRPRNAPHLYGGPYPFIQTGDVANSEGYIRAHTQTYSEAGLLQSKLWPARTLCITIAANIAKTAILTYPAAFPDSVVGFTPAPDVTVEFIQVWFGFLQEVLEATAPEVAQKNINLEILRSLPCPRPPFPLQDAYSQIAVEHALLRNQQRESLREAEHLVAALLQTASAVGNDGSASHCRSESVNRPASTHDRD